MFSNPLYLRTVVLCSLVLCSISVYAQRQIVGFVVNEMDSLPIHNASVILYSDSTQSKLVTYKMTDKKGFFSLLSPNNAEGYIVVRSVGYEDIFLDNIKECDSLHLKMRKSSIQLDEITVKGRYSGIKVKGDSIIFDVTHFKTGTEENVSDVLRNLPGVNVSNTGKLSYGGRDINKVLVNGQDIMDVGTGMMINGLSSDIINGVQIINNWKDGSIQEDYNDRNRTALNIETKKNTRTVGSIEGSYGILNKYELKPTLMTNSEKLSLTAVGSSNNYGGEVFSFEEYLSSFIDIQNVLNDGMGTLTLSETERLMLSPPQNVYKSLNSAIAINCRYIPSKTVSIKSGVLFNHSNFNSLDDSNTNYFMSNFESFDRDLRESTNKMFSANITLKWKPSKHFELTSFTIGSLNDYSKRRDIETSTSEHYIKAFQDELWKKKQIGETLAVNLRVGNNGLIFANASIIENYSKIDLDILSDSLLIDTQYIINDGFYEYDTNRKVPSFIFNSELGYSHKFKNKRMLRLSVLYGNERENIENKGFTDKILKDTYTYSRYGISLRISKQSGLLRYSFGNSVIWNHCQYVTDINKTSVEWCPEIMLHLVFSPKQELRISGQRSVSEVPYERFLTYGIPTGYNSFRTSSLMKSPLMTKEQFFLHYRIIEQYYNFLLFINANYSREKGGGMDKIRQDGIISYHTYVDGGKIKNMGASLTIRKGLGNLPVDGQLYMGYNLSSLPFALGENITDYRMSRFSSSLTFSTRHLGPINAEIKGMLETTENKTSWYKNKSNEYSVSIKLMYAKNKWKGELLYSYEIIDGDLSYHSNNNIGFRISYNLKQLYFRLSGTNVLHLRKYEWSETNTSINYDSKTQYLRIPGYILATMGWRF